MSAAHQQPISEDENKRREELAKMKLVDMTAGEFLEYANLAARFSAFGVVS